MLLILMLSVSLMSKVAFSACIPFDSFWLVSPGTISVHTSDPVGTVYKVVQLEPAGYECADYATYNYGVKSYAPSLTYTGQGRAYFNSGVQGVGFSLAAGSISPIWIPPGQTSAIPYSSGRADIYWGSTFQFVKTGNIQAGNFNSGIVAAYIVSENGAWQTETPIQMGAGNVVVIQDTCTVNTPTVNVNLGVWNTGDLSGIGSKTTDVPVNMSLACQNSGIAISATITADADASQSGTIKLTAGSTSASGVGVQLVDSNGNPLTLNNKFTVTSSTNVGAYNPGWKARYIQTGNTVTPGDGNAMVTVAFNYN